MEIGNLRRRTMERGTDVDTISQALRNLGPMRLAIMGAVIFGLVGFFIFLATKLTTPSMALLYGDLEQSDSQRIISQLRAQNIPHEVRSNGGQIMVSEKDVLNVRLALANEGLPSGGSVGYEIFDDVDSLGTTNFMQNVNLVRALEGELARTIGTIGSVKNARVHLVLPRRELFSRERQQPSASVVLQMRGAVRLENQQVQAVRHLVASAVPSLTPSRISIIDNKGTLLAGGFDDDAGGAAAAADKTAQRRRKIENNLGRTIEELIEKTVGFGRVRTEVSAEIDFDRISTQEEIYNPDGQVVRSTQTVEQGANAQDTEGTPPVSVGTNLPDPTATSGDSATSQSNENRTEETVNFEISKRVINHVREAGVIKKLSVAVLVDEIRLDAQGQPLEDENGDSITQRRSDEEMELLSTLVRGAIGFDEERGDRVEIIQMRFAAFEEPEVELDLFFGLDKNDLLRLAEFFVLGIVAILIILLVLRPLISRAFESMPSAQEAAERLLADQTSGAPALAGPGAGPGGGHMDGMEEEEQFEELIDIDRVEGRVKASSVKKVGEIVEKHPEEALSIVRSWMYQEV